MTDQELIQLLQQKSAAELTAAEVETIRTRWTQSPELRQALVEHLHLESQLIGALGPVQLDVEMILKRASEQQRTERTSLPRWPWIIGLCLFMTVAAGLYYYGTTTPTEVAQIVKVNLPVPPTSDPLPADAMLPTNRQEISADAALVRAMGDDPVVPSTTTADQPSPHPAAGEMAANEPWAAALAREIAPWPVNSSKLTTDYKSAGHDECPDSEARRWLAAVDGHPYVWATDSFGNPARRISRFQGMAKLRAPWPDDAVLRLTPFEVTDLTLYFWRGPTGIALRFYTRREPHLWAAFEISRENSTPRPTRFGLLTTDSGTYTRSTPGMLDFRLQNGELVVARGGIVLLSVPFIGSPMEVFVEGQFRLRGISMFRSAPFASQPANEHPIVVSGPAAKLPWAASADSEARLLSNPDGSVSMTFDSRDKTGVVSLPFGWLRAMQQSPQATGLFEVIVCVESADPGTGIYLGDRDGRPQQQLGFFKDAATQQITFGILRPGELRVDSNHNPLELPPPYLARSGWLKLVAGLGTLHILSSGDGHHWGHVVDSPGRDLPGAIGSMGLFGLAGPTARTIRVREVQVRELTGITSLCDPGVRSLVPPFKSDAWKDVAAWNHHVLDTQPADVNLEDWFTANAVAALSQGPPKELGLQLLRQLIAVGLRSARSFEQKRQMLDDACALSDLFDDATARTIGIGYEALGTELADAGDAAPLAMLRPAWLWSPIWTSSKMRYVWERLHSREILQAVYRHDWPAAWKSAQSAGYWNLLPHPDQRPVERGEDLDRHARWTRALVAEAAPQLDDGTGGVMPIGLRHPLVPVLNKEAYNVRAELQSALSGQNYEDAGRIVMSIAELDGPGLLPDPDDRQLYVSMAAAITMARKSHPGFAQTMSDTFEPLGQIRVQSAMNRHDLVGLQTATLQFMGTDAARTAHQWLGDIALSVGQFEAAEQHFRDALVDASLRWQESLQPRWILAKALGGRISPTQNVEIETPLPTRPFDFNGTTISPEEFQGVIRDLAARSSLGNTLVESPQPATAPFPQAAYKLEPRAQFDGHPGNNPGNAEYRFGDPFGRQLSVVSDNQRIYVSNRFQVNAYSPSEGKQIWAQGLGSEQGEAYALPLTAMRPLLTGDRLFVRRLTKAGAELACLKADDGQVLWHQRPGHSVVSDPIVWNRRLFALTLAKVDEEQMQVEAAWFDPKSGQVTSSRPLFRLRDATNRQFSAQLAVSDRIAVCTIAGTTASFDSRGDMRWLRRNTFLQKPVDELTEDTRVAPPVIQSGHVITALPGVREVTCLDLDSGSILWERPIFNLRGLVTASLSRLVVDTPTNLIGIDSASGEIAWQRQVDARLEAVNLDGQTLTITRRTTFPNNRSKPVLQWLDLETGEERAQCLIDVADREEFQMGPLFTAGGKWWSFVGQTWKDPKRDLHELNAVPAALPQSFMDETLLSWKTDTPDFRLAEIQSVVPGWFPAANYRDRLVLYPGDLRGETFSLVSHLDPQNSIRFNSRVALAPGRRQTLRLRVGTQPGQKWKLTLRTRNHVLVEQEIDEAVSGWRDVAVDLSPYAGQNLPLQIIQSTSSPTAVDAFWKRAELMVE